MPLNDLIPECVKYLQSIGSSSTKVSDIIDNKDTVVYKAIGEGIFRLYNLKLLLACL